MDNILNLIGLAKKAGRLEIGEEPVGAAARSRQAKLILLADDAADNTVRRAGHFAEAGNVAALKVPYDKAQLGMAVGRASCAMLALTDTGLAASLLKKLSALDPERYGETAAALDTKAVKVLKRQKEQRAHEKNLQRGKAKPWAVPEKSGAERRSAEKGKAPPLTARGRNGAPSGGAKGR